MVIYQESLNDARSKKYKIKSHVQNHPPSGKYYEKRNEGNKHKNHYVTLVSESCTRNWGSVLVFTVSTTAYTLIL